MENTLMKNEKMYIIIASNSTNPDKEPIILPASSTDPAKLEEQLQILIKAHPSVILGKDQVAIMEVKEVSLVKTIHIDAPDVRAVLEDFLDIMDRQNPTRIRS